MFDSGSHAQVEIFKRLDREQRRIWVLLLICERDLQGQTATRQGQLQWMRAHAPALVPRT